MFCKYYTKNNTQVWQLRENVDKKSLDKFYKICYYNVIDTIKSGVGALFDASDGFFHFVFAEQDDDYYTPEGLKLCFVPYLCCQLIKAGYGYIYLLGDERQGLNDFCLLSVGSRSDSLLGSDSKKKKGFRGGFFSGRSRNTEDSEHFNAVKREINDEKELKEYFCKILDILEKKKEAVLAVPIDIFSSMAQNDDVRKILSKLRDKKNENALVIISGVGAEENNRYFIKNDNEQIFFDSGIFPEFSKELKKYSDKSAVFVYDILKSAFGSRMNVLNGMEFENVLNVIRYVFFRIGNTGHLAKSDKIAKVIWRWSCDLEFRDNHSVLRLPTEENRKYKAVANCLTNSETVGKILEAAEKDNLPEPSENSGRIYISRTNENDNIVSIINEFKNFLRNRRLLDYNKQTELNKFLEFLEKPFYYNVKVVLYSALYVQFQESENLTFLKEMLSFLKDGHELNEWDKVLYESLYDMIMLCRTELELPNERNRYIFDLKFRTYKTVLRKCRCQSQLSADENEAKKFAKDIHYYMRLENDRDIKAFEREIMGELN